MNYKEEQQESKMRLRQVMVPAKGNVSNPALKYPRNMKCFCGSELKFKKCCMDKIPRALKIEDAEKLRSAVAAVRNG